MRVVDHAGSVHDAAQWRQSRRDLRDDALDVRGLRDVGGGDDDPHPARLELVDGCLRGRRRCTPAHQDEVPRAIGWRARATCRPRPPRPPVTGYVASARTWEP